jgi:hypothetical protein
MADNRTFTLIGKFDDQITPQLKKLNRTFAAFEKTINRGMGRSFRELNKDLRSFAKDLDSIGDIFDRKAARGLNKFRDGIKAASEDARLLGKTLGDASQVGDNFGAGMKDGIRAAQSEAKVLGDILKANALIQVGQGVSNALGAGAASTLGVLQKGAGFFAKQFRAAVQDELEDMQARGSLYGSLKKQGVFVGKTEKEQTRDYRQTKRISRINEEVIGNIVRESPVSTATVSTLNRQLTDNLLPLMLKSRGITNLGTQSEAELEKTFGGKKGVGTELAKLYEQMAMLMPSPQYARMGAMGFTQAITSGTINRQLAIFEGNPVLVEALKTIDGGIQATSDIGKRVQIIKKALEVAAPTMMLEEMRMSVAGGLQAVQDTLTNPSVGILSMAMEVAGQGKRTMEDFGKINGKIVKGSAYEMRLADMRKKQIERMGPRESWNAAQKEKALLEEQAFIDKLDDILANANTPLERIAVSLAPVLQSVSGVLNAMGSIFMGPVNGAMKVLDTVFAKLSLTLDNLASDLRGKTRTVPEAFGRMVGEIFKAFANLFDPTTVGKETGSAIDKMFADFKKGFDSVDGSKWMKMVVDGLNDIIMRLLFNEGNVMKGVTPLGDGLAKIFLLLSAPAFISALISGLVPVALLSMGGMLKAVFMGLTKKGGAGTGGAAAGLGAFITPGGARAARGIRGAAGFGGGLLGLAYSLGGRPGLKAGRGLANALGGIGGAAGKVGRFVPGGALAFGALDAGVRMASGQDAGKAIGGAAAATIGSVLGGILGQALIPVPGVGAAVGGIAGGIIGDKVGNFLMQPSADQRQAAQMQLQAGLKQLDAAGKASQEKYGEFGPKLGGVEALNRALGGGAGVKNYAVEQLKLGKILPQQAREWSALGSELSTLNNKTEAVNKAQAAYNVAKAASTGEEKKAASNLSKAKSEQLSALRTISQNWESMSSASRVKILQASDEIAAALNAGAARIKGVSVTNAPGRPVGLPTRNWKELLPPPAPGTRRIYNGRYSYTDVPADSKSDNNGPRNEGWPLSHFSTKNWGEGCSVGSLGGSQAGSVDAFNSVARGKGLSLTSGYRPGSRGFHGINRARDYSNGYSPTPQMLSFATHMAQTYGANLRELIYTPLGFSIKNGRKVPPYATEGHYNHVHVAYALGAGMPAFFSSQRAAMDWERKATLGNVKVSSITSNSSEGMGGAVSVNAPITIYQQPGQNSEQLAALVAMELSNAINQARSSSMYV